MASLRLFKNIWTVLKRLLMYQRFWNDSGKLVNGFLGEILEEIIKQSKVEFNYEDGPEIAEEIAEKLAEDAVEAE